MASRRSSFPRLPGPATSLISILPALSPPLTVPQLHFPPQGHCTSYSFCPDCSSPIYTHGSSSRFIQISAAERSLIPSPLIPCT